MGRLRRLAALLRVVLVAVGLSLAAAVRPTPLAEPGAPSAGDHCARVAAPDPAPALTAARDGDREPPEPEDAAAAPTRHQVAAAAPRRIVMTRGPPRAPPSATVRSHGARGPPGPV
jgi:hypothetical protein